MKETVSYFVIFFFLNMVVVYVPIIINASEKDNLRWVQKQLAHQSIMKLCAASSFL